jgi:hypothetical protein
VNSAEMTALVSSIRAYVKGRGEHCDDCGFTMREPQMYAILLLPSHDRQKEDNCAMDGMPGLWDSLYYIWAMVRD